MDELHFLAEHKRRDKILQAPHSFTHPYTTFVCVFVCIHIKKSHTRIQHWYMGVCKLHTPIYHVVIVGRAYNNHMATMDTTTLVALATV